MEPRIQLVNVGVVTQGGVMEGFDGPMINILPTTLKAVQFDVNVEKESFFDIRDMLNKNTDKLTICEMPPVFDSTRSLGSSRKVSTLKCFLESFLTLAKYPNALAKIEIFIYQ